MSESRTSCPGLGAQTAPLASMQLPSPLVRSERRGHISEQLPSPSQLQLHNRPPDHSKTEDGMGRGSRGGGGGRAGAAPLLAFQARPFLV